MAYGALWKASLLGSAALVLAACEEDPDAIFDGAVDAAEPDDAGTDASEDANGEDANGEDASSDASQAMRDVAISFEARVGSALFDCNQTYSDLGTSKVAATLNDFRLYVYDVRLLNDAGDEVPLELTQDGEFQYQDLVLLDFEDRTGNCLNGTPETNTLVQGKLPAGNYTGVRFGVGVPFALNHGNFNMQPAPLNLSAMAWPWTLGHLFVRIDARVATDSGPRPAFLVHLGSDMCSGNPAADETVSCVRPNRAAIELAEYDPDGDKIVLDYEKLVADVALDDDQGGETGCMAGASDPECKPIFERLGVDGETGSPSGAVQSVFSAEPK